MTMNRLNIAGWVLLFAVASFGIPACGGDSKPKAFPGTAHEKATELVRRLDARDIDHIGAQALASEYGTDGPDVCESDQTPEDRRALTDALNEEVDMPPELAATLADFETVTIGVYCPWQL